MRGLSPELFRLGGGAKDESKTGQDPGPTALQEDRNIDRTQTSHFAIGNAVQN